MSSYQPPEEQGSILIPTVDITDYSAQGFEDYADPSTSGQPYLPSSSNRSRRNRLYTETSLTGSDTERDASDMSSRSSKQPSSSRRHSGSSKSKVKTDNWTDVTEPEERRRIQNRIAQRKFREKAREQKEQQQRDLQNQQHAHASYTIPEPDELVQEEDVSGLPWGSLNIGHIVARGHASASQQSSRHTSDQRVNGMQQYITPYSGDTYGQVASFDGWDSSGDDAIYYAESPYYYNYNNPSPDNGHGFEGSS